MDEIRVTSWNDFQDSVFRNSWRPEILRHRQNFVFRGLSHSTNELITSLQRICKNNLHLEKALIRNFKKYASLEIKAPDNFWEIISLGQHHGLPTRLLDWTFSPYVALHFATENYSHYNYDGAIWCINYIKFKEYLPEKLRKSLTENAATGFSVDMLYREVKNFAELSSLSDEAFIVFFEPPSIDERIVNQYALFSLLSDSSIVLSEWLTAFPDICYKIIIPAEKKMEFRDKLDQINMTERIMYPGLDGLCKWLARHYTPSQSIYPNMSAEEITRNNNP